MTQAVGAGETIRTFPSVSDETSGEKVQSSIKEQRVFGRHGIKAKTISPTENFSNDSSKRERHLFAIRNSA